MVPGLLARAERLNEILGQLVAWLTLVMVLVTFGIVVLRYAFDLGWIWLQESVTWMHAAVFMLAAAYTWIRDDQVRVDVFYRTASPRYQALVDGLGTLLFLFPFCGFMFWSSLDYVTASWSIGEASREAGGLGYPAVPLMKLFIPVTALLLMLQGLVTCLRCWRVLRSGEKPPDNQQHSWPV